MIEVISYPNEIIPETLFTIVFTVKPGLLAMFGGDSMSIISDEISGSNVECNLIGGEAPVLICNRIQTYCYSDSKYESSGSNPFSKYEKSISLYVDKKITSCNGNIKVIIQHVEWFFILPALLDRVEITYAKENNSLVYVSKRTVGLMIGNK